MDMAQNMFNTCEPCSTYHYSIKGTREVYNK